MIKLFKIKANAMARTSKQDPYSKNAFRLSIPNLPSGILFKAVSGLSQEHAVVEYSEGGDPATKKMPGRIKTSEVTAERGMYEDSALETLFKNVAKNSNFRQTMVFHQLDNTGNISKSYKLAEAWISKWEGSDYDADSDDVAIEKITIQFEYFL